MLTIYTIGFNFVCKPSRMTDLVEIPYMMVLFGLQTKWNQQEYQH